MKKILTFILIASSLFYNNPIYAATTYKGWQTINVPNICTFQIPPTMEIQAGSYKAIMDSFSRNIDVIIPEIVVQQRGLNKMEKKAQGLYARLILNTYTNESNPEPLLLGDKLKFSKDDLVEIDKTLKDGYVEEFSSYKQKTGQTMRLVKWKGIKIVNINNTECLLSTYTRQIENNPVVIVYMYEFFNNDISHMVTVSYREKDISIWKPDLDQKIIKTFNFIKH